MIIGAAIKAPREQVAFLITRDLLGCGIALLQSVMSGDFGIRVPVIVGVTFAAVGPMVVINLEEKPNNLSRSSSSGSFRISSVAFSWRRSLSWCSMLLQWCSRARNAWVRPVDAAHGVGGVESTSHD